MADDTPNPNDKKWSKDESGKIVMPELQSEYLDWLLTDTQDRYPDTEAEWCRAHNVARDTCAKWKRDRRFKEQWERRATDKNVSPDRLQRVIDVLYNSAVGTGDVAAAKQFLLYAEKLLPPKEVRRDASVTHLTDAELLAEVDAIATAGFGAVESGVRPGLDVTHVRYE